MDFKKRYIYFNMKKLCYVPLYGACIIAIIYIIITINVKNQNLILLQYNYVIVLWIAFFVLSMPYTLFLNVFLRI